MNNRYNLSNLEALFRDYLGTCRISKISIKNYASDLKHFLTWFMYKRIDTTTDESHLDLFISSISPQVVRDYIEYLQNDSIPVLTINRRLSTLRKFFVFCQKREIVLNNPVVDIRNLERPSLKQEIKVTQQVEKTANEEEADIEADFIQFMKSRGEEVDAGTLSEFKSYIE